MTFCTTPETAVRDAWLLADGSSIRGPRRLSIDCRDFHSGGCRRNGLKTKIHFPRAPDSAYIQPVPPLMKAIIIGAGRGRRLMPTTADTPKCYAEVQGHRLLDWALRAFAGANVRDICFIGGYQ